MPSSINRPESVPHNPEIIGNSGGQVVQPKQPKVRKEPDKMQQYQQLKSNLAAAEFNLRGLEAKCKTYKRLNGMPLKEMQAVVAASNNINACNNYFGPKVGRDAARYGISQYDYLLVSRYSQEEIALMRQILDTRKQIDAIKDQMNALEQAGVSLSNSESGFDING